MFALMIIGALPRMGKTFLLRLLALAAALDTSAELHLYDLKAAPTSCLWRRSRTGSGSVTNPTTSRT